MEAFEAYFKQADLNQDGRISGQEAVAFLGGSNLPQQVLAQIWMYADQNKTGFLSRPEFFNALRLVTVAQSGRQLTPEIVKSALYGPAAAKIPPPKITTAPSPPAKMISVAAPRPQGNSMMPASAQIGAVQMNPAGALRPQGNSMMPASTQIGAVQMHSAAASRPQGNSMMPTSTQMGALPSTQFSGPRGLQTQPPSVGVNQQLLSSNTGFMRPPQAVPPATSLQAPGVNQGLMGGGSVSGPRPPNSSTMDLSVDWLGNKTSSVGGVAQAPPRAITPSQTTTDGFGLSLSSTAGMTSGQQTQAIPSSSLPPNTNSTVLPQDSKTLVLSGNGFSSAPGSSNDVFSALSQSKPSVSASAFSASTTPSTSSFTSTSSSSQNLMKLAQLDSLQNTPTVSSGGNQFQQTRSITKPDQFHTSQSTTAPATPNISAGPSSSASQWPKISQSDIQKYTKVFEDVDKDRDGKITGVQARTLFLSWRLPREVLKQVWDLSDQDNDGMLSLREFCIALYLMERHRAGIPLPPVLPDALKYDETLLRATGLPSTAYSGPSWQQNPVLSHRGSGAPVLPATGMRPPLPPHLSSHADGVMKPGQPKSHMPTMDNNVVNQVSRYGQNVVNSEAQGVAAAPKKVQEVEKQILDSKEKLEFYRTKMQDLVLYKSRCDNRLNEITERASADKREVESLAKKYEEKYKQVGELASKVAVEEATFRDVQERKLELHNAIIKMEQGGSVDGLLQVRADRLQYQLEEMERALSERCKHFGLHVKPATSIELPFGWEPGVQEGAVDWDEDWDKFEDEGFALIKDNGTIVENIVSAENTKSPSLWDDSASMDEVSNGHVKDERHYRGGDQVTESESGYDHSEESARSPGSPGRSAFESPFVAAQFGTHDTSPGTKESYSDHGGTESNIFGDKYADETSWNFDDHDTESVWGSSTVNTMEGDHQRSTRNSFFGSDDFGLNPVRVGSPSGASVFGKKKSPFFDDSVPSSPSFTSGFSPKFNESRDDSTSYDFGRFDSFRTQDSGIFPQDHRFSRFDSINSSKGEGLTRFDSMNSSRNFGHNRGFDSFDEADPFGSSGPFKASGSRSPSRFS